MPIPVIISTLVTIESSLFLLKKQKLATHSSSQYKVYIEREYNLKANSLLQYLCKEK